MESCRSGPRSDAGATGKLQNATYRRLRHFMSAAGPLQRPTDDAFEAGKSPCSGCETQAPATIFLVASTSDFTAATDLSNIAFSSALNDTSTIFSTPSLPT